ncbi:hypothetical protein Tco_0964829 [Tanacetum coccineum]
MSDSDESGVIYTEISSTFEELSDIGSSGVVPSPDYIPGPEEPQSPPLLDYVPEPIYPEYMPQEDEVFPVEEQPLPAAASPTTQSPDFVPKSDLEADPEEDNDEDPEEDPVNYPADGGDDGDDGEGISIPAPVPTPVWFDAEVARLLAISTPPSSPLSPWSSPLPHIPSPPLPSIPSLSLPVSPLLPVSSLVHMLSPSPPVSPIRTPPLHLLSTDRREDRPEVTLPPQKRLGIALGPAYEVGESLSAAARPARGLRADYGFVANMDREIRRDPERDVGYGIIDSEILLEARRIFPLSTHNVSTVCPDIRELQSADHRRQTVILELLAADYRRQRQLTEALKLVKSLQTQMAELHRQQGPAKGPAQPELPEEAGSSS